MCRWWGERLRTKNPPRRVGSSRVYPHLSTFSQDSLEAFSRLLYLPRFLVHTVIKTEATRSATSNYLANVRSSRTHETSSAGSSTTTTTTTTALRVYFHYYFYPLPFSATTSSLFLSSMCFLIFDFIHIRIILFLLTLRPRIR